MVRKGTGAQICFVCFYVSRYYHDLLIVQINPFGSSQSHSATELVKRFSVSIFSRSALAEGARIILFFIHPPPRGPEFAVGGPVFLYGRGLYSVELVDWKGFGTKRRWPDSRYCSAI